MKIVFAILTMILILPAAYADTRYVTSNPANTELHGIENTWNARYLNTTSDYNGTLPGFSESATSADGKVSMTLKVSGISYFLDLGELDFNPLDPMQESKCSYWDKVNKFEAVGSGSVTVKAPVGQVTYSCSSVKMGVKNFLVTGNVAVTDLSLAFSNGIVTVDSSDYYFAYNCQLDQRTTSFDSTSVLPEAYRQLLSQKMRKPTSNWSLKAMNTTRTKVKGTMVQIRQN